MTRLVLIISLVISSFFLFTTPVPAATVLGDDKVKVSRDISDDVYIFGGNITVSGDIHGDLIVGGGNIRVTGTIDGDLMAGGGQITIDGPVRETVRVGGGSITINGPVARDVLVGGGTVMLGADSVIGGDLLAGAGNLTAAGVIKDDIRGSLGAADIAGTVGGDINVTVDRLTVSDGALVKGDLTYTSERKAQISDGSRVAGAIKRRTPEEPRTLFPGSLFPGFQLLGWLWSLVGMILTALTIAWLFPATLEKTGEALFDRPGTSFGFGFAALFLTPIAAILLIVFTLGLALPISLLALTFYAVGIYLAQIYAAATVGTRALNSFSPENRWIGAGAIVGIVFFGVLRLVPFVGGFVTFVLILFGLGAISLACWESWSTSPPRRQHGR